MCVLMLVVPLHAAFAAGLCAQQRSPVATTAPLQAQPEHCAKVASDHHDAGTHAKSSCSACAVCCLGAALPVASLGLAAVPLAGALTFPVATPDVGFVTDGPERPPRSPLV